MMFSSQKLRSCPAGRMVQANAFAKKVCLQARCQQLAGGSSVHRDRLTVHLPAPPAVTSLQQCASGHIQPGIAIVFKRPRVCIGASTLAIIGPLRLMLPEPETAAAGRSAESPHSHKTSGCAPDTPSARCSLCVFRARMCTPGSLDKLSVCTVTGVTQPRLAANEHVQSAPSDLPARLHRRRAYRKRSPLWPCFTAQSQSQVACRCSSRHTRLGVHCAVTVQGAPQTGGKTRQVAKKAKGRQFDVKVPKGPKKTVQIGFTKENEVRTHPSCWWCTPSVLRCVVVQEYSPLCGIGSQDAGLWPLTSSRSARMHKVRCLKSCSCRQRAC
jgi:hypothetical protein